MIAINDADLLRKAYEAMTLDSAHRWAISACKEVDFLLRNRIVDRHCRVLDFGCGSGRHSIELAKAGIRVHGVDFSPKLIEHARKTARGEGLGGLATFEVADCRTYRSREKFDVVLCLYDVIGSLPDDDFNSAIVDRINDNLIPCGIAAVSVLSLARTLAVAKFSGNVDHRPELLDNLVASDAMERTGEIFNPDHFVLDESRGIVYRKERFSSGGLEGVYLMRDRRYLVDDLVRMFFARDFVTADTYHVCAGRWDEDLPADRGKEVLFIGRKKPTEWTNNSW